MKHLLLTPSLALVRVVRFGNAVRDDESAAAVAARWCDRVETVK